MIDSLQLTRDLVAIETTNPPGREAECGSLIADILSDNGFDVRLDNFEEDRLNIVAQLPGKNADEALVLTGHIDTVPLGSAEWSVDPFAGEINGDRLYGRGVTDMKAGVAAMIAAAARHREADLRRPLALIFTSGEETGCIGARALCEHSRYLLPNASAMIVGEPTGNRISIGHKGCCAVQVTVNGVTAHSSMPHSGVNAIYAAADAVARVREMEIDWPADPLLGAPTKNVGMISGGFNYNSVPDRAQFTVDVRSLPGMSHDQVEELIAGAVGQDMIVQRFVDMPPVGISYEDNLTKVLAQAVRNVCGENADVDPRGTPFFSDASVLQPALDCPTIIFGPGEPAMAHQIDEWCLVENIRTAEDIYFQVIEAWCSKSPG